MEVIRNFNSLPEIDKIKIANFLWNERIITTSSGFKKFLNTGRLSLIESIRYIWRTL